MALPIKFTIKDLRKEIRKIIKEESEHIQDISIKIGDTFSRSEPHYTLYRIVRIGGENRLGGGKPYNEENVLWLQKWVGNGANGHWGFNTLVNPPIPESYGIDKDAYLKGLKSGKFTFEGNHNDEEGS